MVKDTRSTDGPSRYVPILRQWHVNSRLFCVNAAINIVKLNYSKDIMLHLRITLHHNMNFILFVLLADDR